MRWIPFIALVLSLACAGGENPVTPGLPDGGPSPDAAIGFCSTDPCFPGVQCTNGASAFECGPCPVGREGDGETCTEIDGCAGGPCAAGVDCTDAPAPELGFSCGPCPSGRDGDGETCTEIDGCAGAPCAAGVNCTDVPAPGNGFSCGTCPVGTAGDGETCTDIDGCQQVGVCFAGVACTDVPAPGSGATCGPCPSGYSGDGTFCDLLCEPEVTLGCGSSLSTSTNGLGSKDVIDNWECAPTPLTGRELVFSFTAPSTGIAAASITGLSADLDLLVIEDTGSICNPADSLSCVFGGYSGNSGTDSELVRWDAIENTTYYIVVDGFNGATSNFNLQVGTAAGDVLLNEISSGVEDFVEIRNHGSCPVNLGDFTFFHAPSCGTAFQFTFPTTSLAARSVYRATEVNTNLLPNEVSLGFNVCDFADEIGYTALCFGSPCEPASSCNNLIDYVERDGDLSDGTVPATPACLTFEPNPVDVSSLTGIDDQSVRRAGFLGAPLSFESSDWTLGPVTLD